MAKKALPVFTRDPRTGSMKELAPDEPKDFALASDLAGPPHFRVLVADDDETDRLLTIWQLGKAWPFDWDIVVECAADGAEALEKIHRRRFELVVLDWNMPHQDGGDVLRAMRGNGLHIPVVVVSAQRHEAIASDLKAMAATFVHKDELAPRNFRSAIAASIQLQEMRHQAEGRAESGFPDSPTARAASSLGLLSGETEVPSKMEGQATSAQ